jgi:hypothetical protein
LGAVTKDNCVMVKKEGPDSGVRINSQIVRVNVYVVIVTVAKVDRVTGDVARD